MIKKFFVKLFIFFLQFAIISTGVFGLAGFEHSIIKVSAQVDPIAFMGPNADFGIVFPSETLEKDFYVKAQDDYSSTISYNLITRVKPRTVSDAAYCLNNPVDHIRCYPLLCGHLDIISEEGEGDIKTSAALAPPVDNIDSWKVILKTPPIQGSASQRFVGEPVEKADEYGCDVELVLSGSESGSDDPPVIKAKWEMDANKDENGKYAGSDDSPESGAQFLPSGQFEVDKNITVCAIAADSDGVGDVNGVYADVFYPTGISTGPNHDSEHLGCGKSLGEFSLIGLNKADGYDLFCGRIKNNNNNLPIFYGSYNYSEICGEIGELMKETAKVYCGEKSLSYESPSGNYKTLVLARDKAGLSATFENQFYYLPLTAFSTDFDHIDYGKVRLNTHKIIIGDLIFQDGDGKSTVRNIGNTRFDLAVLQDDMGLGKTDGLWNIKYDARIGNNELSWENYYPLEIKTLKRPLDLSETNKMDFSVNISKFPSETIENYSGVLTLSAIYRPHLICE